MVLFRIRSAGLLSTFIGAPYFIYLLKAESVIKVNVNPKIDVLGFTPSPVGEGCSEGITPHVLTTSQTPYAPRGWCY